jgi:WD40 repeat protein/predicted MPP superfamily phosphohydrolase
MRAQTPSPNRVPLGTTIPQRPGFAPATGNRVWQVDEVHTSSVSCVAWSSDGKWLATGSDDATIWIWESATGKPVRVQIGHTDFINSVAWSPDGKWLASGSFDETVGMWKAATGKLVRELKAPTSSVNSVAWSPDGKWLASCSDDAAVRIWEPDMDKPARVLEGYPRTTNSAAWSPDGKWLASGFDDDTVRIWEAETGKLARALQGHRGPVNSVAWSSDGKWLASGSRDKTVGIWEAATGKLMRQMEVHIGSVNSLAWSPNGKWLASGSNDETVGIWEAATGNPVRQMEVHIGSVNSLAWSPDGKWFASGSDDATVRIWEAETGKLARALQGHRGPVNSVAWSPDGQWLASGSRDNTVGIWEAATGKLARLLEGHVDSVSSVMWSIYARLLVTTSFRCEVKLWRTTDGTLLKSWEKLGYRNLHAALTPALEHHVNRQFGEWFSLRELVVRTESEESSEQFISAKVVFVGESNTGKSCLALRLARDEYRELGTTHGMQIWPIKPETLDPQVVYPRGENREVVLWDMGGQLHYQLIHQLFLPDTRVAVVLFDPTRDKQGFEAVEDWTRRLELASTGFRKLLVRSKADQPGVPDHQRIDRLREECRFDDFLSVSALKRLGIPELGRRILELIDWNSLTPVTRSPRFEAVHASINEARQQEKCVFFEDDLLKAATHIENMVTKDDVNAVALQLSRQGQLVDLRDTYGKRVLVLRVDVVEKYAGSLILLAKSHPRGVPVVEQRRLGSLSEFPGIMDAERVSHAEERIVLESVVELFITRGVAVQHSGLLIFPSEFPQEKAPDLSEVPHRKPLYYEFDGPINNIWASLVANVTVSGEFGSVRLWANRAEYEQAGKGVFGLYLREVRRGCGHLDVYFSDSAEETKRDLFISYVDSHLRESGVRLVERLGMKCACEQELEEEWFRNALGRGEHELKCPKCGTTYPVLTGAQTALQNQPGLVVKLNALKVKVERGLRNAADEVKRAAVRAAAQSETLAREPIRILHLSDLHFAGTEPVWGLLQPLVSDLRESLHVRTLDYVVVSGDFADKCQEDGFSRAEQFLNEMIHEFNLSGDRLILCPGNHDLNRLTTVYEYREQRPAGFVADEAIELRDGGFLVRNRAEYPKRFESFRKMYHNLVQRPYPLAHVDQGVVIWYPESEIEFLTLNSAWEIDSKFPDRATINLDALGKAILESKKHPAKLRIVVWHHPVRAERQISNQQVISNLIQAGYRLCLHGDIHRETAEIIGQLDPKNRLHVAGTGSLGQGGEGTPRLYNLLEVDRQFKSVQVRMRAQRQVGGAFGPHAVVPTEDPNTGSSCYEIALRNSTPM